MYGVLRILRRLTHYVPFQGFGIEHEVGARIAFTQKLGPHPKRERASGREGEKERLKGDPKRASEPEDERWHRRGAIDNESPLNGRGREQLEMYIMNVFVI